MKNRNGEHVILSISRQRNGLYACSAVSDDGDPSIVRELTHLKATLMWCTLMNKYIRQGFEPLNMLNKIKFFLFA